MTEAAGLLLAGFAAAAVLNWIAVARGLRLLEYATKPLAVGLLAGVALTLEPAVPAQRTLFVAALGASLAGDVVLMLPAAKGGTRRGAGVGAPPAFLAGAGAFLLAHAAYVAGFLRAGVEAPGLLAGTAVAALGAGTVGRGILRAVGGPRSLVAALGGYLAVISALLIAAFGSGEPLALLGATLFFTSDALIGWSRFVRARGWHPPAIMVTYHLGQAGLVLSLSG